MTALADKSSLLDQLAEAQLQLKRGVFFQQQTAVDGYGYLLCDEREQAYLQCSNDVYDFIAQFDGVDTLETLIKKQKKLNSSVALKDLEDVIHILLSMNLLNIKGIDGKGLSWVDKIKQPMAVKIPLFNPDKLLEKLNPISYVIFSYPVLVLFTLLLLYSISVFSIHWDALSLHWESRFFDPINAIYMLIAYPLMKILHELAHGLALKRFGGRVLESGILFLVFIPLPYVNASASYRLNKKAQRVLVGMAGMLIEFFMAICALNIWVYTTAGTIESDFLFDMFFIGTFSTLIFNINPLMKFDGYYILSDVLSIVNLSQKSKSYISYLMTSIVFGIKSKQYDFIGREKKWLFLYGVLSIPYRLFISLFITLYLSSMFFAFGAFLALYVLIQQVILPVLNGLRRTYQVVLSQGKAIRFWSVVASAMSLLVLLGVILQFSYGFTIQGVVVLDKNEQVTAGAAGHIHQQFVVSGEKVIGGQPIALLTNPLLSAQEQNLTSSLRELKAKYNQILTQDHLAAADISEQIEAVQLELDEVEQQVRNLTLVAPIDGEFVKPRWEDALGRYIERGSLIGHVINNQSVLVKAVIDPVDFEKITEDLMRVSVMFTALPTKHYSAELVRIVPAAQDQLPSQYLGSLRGGDIAVDDRDKAGTTMLRNHFLIEVSVSGFENELFKPVNARIKFVLAEASISERLIGWIRTHLLQTFNWSM